MMILLIVLFLHDVASFGLPISATQRSSEGTVEVSKAGRRLQVNQTDFSWANVSD